MSPREDPRKLRTRAALVHAFNELVLEGNDGQIRVADIISRADVGRSTFYEHYSNADEIHMEALSRPLSLLADAIVGAGVDENLRWLLNHFWENRSRARQMFLDMRKRDHVARLLVRLLEERLGERDDAAYSLAIRQLAEAPLAVIGVWISGEIACTADSVAATIRQSSRLLLDALPAA